MADDELLAKSPTLRQAGKDLKTASDSLNTEWQSMHSVASGVTFGSDIVSSLIGISYQTAHGMAQKTYNSAAQAFSDFGAAIVAMGGVYDQTEQANTDKVQQIGGAV
ncbi:MAG: hypothetical protein JWL58_3704 [Streptosporangiaceae bacterium]|jgi:hypothetical protein|nr:hypothetical protein [Streptosporangiaceae bacterium]